MLLYLIGDSAYPYPMLTWLIIPFPHIGSLSSEQRSFSCYICRTCIVIENAFGQLKTRHEVHGGVIVDSWMDEVYTLTTDKYFIKHTLAITCM